MSSQQSRGKNWVFTLNNYTDEDVSRLRRLADSVKYLLFGRETGESGTPHLQGMVLFSTTKRFGAVKGLIGSDAHIELCKNVPASETYCKKDDDFEEFGSYQKRGESKREDLEKFKEDVKNGEVNLKRLRDMHSLVFAKYPRFAMEYVTDNAPKRVIIEHELHDWQKKLKTDLDAEPDDRKIVFVVDTEGNKGKTWFAHWYTSQSENCQVIQPGKKADMAYVLEVSVRVLFIDAPRSKQGEYVQYDFLEDVKNGYVFSTKYESKVKQLQKCHVVVLMNEMPDMSKLSADRYEIIDLSAPTVYSIFDI